MARQAEDVSSQLKRNYGEKWQECDICGWPYRVSELGKVRGKSVCSECRDEPAHKEFKN